MTWTPQGYSGGVPTGDVNSYGVAYRISLTHSGSGSGWNFNGTTSVGSNCSQGWFKAEGSCLQGIHLLTPLLQVKRVKVIKYIFTGDCGLGNEVYTNPTTMAANSGHSIGFVSPPSSTSAVSILHWFSDPLYMFNLPSRRTCGSV